ncbi:phosphatase PAP2 family protein [Streptomyces sp. NPDC059524]|uniref:phosphatase PAP2 family protein n=1 Tax=Streptomyces sp. NPDC059524 TaxID=3346856 RepID=UPI0036BDD601
MHPARLDHPHRPLVPRPALWTLAALTLANAVLLVLVAVRWTPLTDMDADVARSLHRAAVADPGLTHANRILTDWVWDPWTMRLLCALVVVYLFVRLREAVLAVWVAVTCAAGTLLQQVLKATLDRPRPVWPDPVDSAHYAAYPSGHAMTAVVVLGLVLWLLRTHGAPAALYRAALAVTVVSVLGVGLTRLWLGVHWPSDVLGGWLLGALTVAWSTTAYDTWSARRGRP